MAADFEAFYREHWARIVALCQSVVGGRRVVAEELAQEAFLVAHRRWSTVSTLDRPDLWLKRVATNLCISSWRRWRCEVRANEVIATRRDVAGSWPPDHDEDRELWDAVRALPRRQAVAVCLHHVDGLSTQEVAQVLGCSASTVQTHLARGRAALSASLRVTTDIEEAAR